MDMMEQAYYEMCTGGRDWTENEAFYSAILACIDERIPPDTGSVWAFIQTLDAAARKDLAEAAGLGIGGGTWLND